MFCNFSFAEVINLSCPKGGNVFDIKIDLNEKKVFDRFKFEPESTNNLVKFMEWQEWGEGEELVKYHTFNLNDVTWEAKIFIVKAADSLKYTFSNFPPADKLFNEDKIDCSK